LRRRRREGGGAMGREGDGMNRRVTMALSCPEIGLQEKQIKIRIMKL
jgi:hypothetical protein